MMIKIAFFFLSLWLFFALIIIITAKVMICFSKDCSFIDFINLITTNIIPILCLFVLLIGAISYFDFKFKMKGTPEISFKINEIENIDYEHLTFITSYFIALVYFHFDNLWYISAFIILLFVIASIYVRTDLFYVNPIPAILKFRIYKINGEFRNGEFRQKKIIIRKDKLVKDDRVKYFKLDDRIYYASKVTAEE